MMRVSLATFLSTVSTLGRKITTINPGRSSELLLNGRRSIVSLRNASCCNILFRGGAVQNNSSSQNELQQSNRSMSSDTKYVKLADPAPGSPFHLALPVHDLEVAKNFYGNILGCAEGRSSEKWQDYSLHGHQIVCHWAGNEYRCQDYFNPVDGDDVPVPHFGLALTEEQFHALAKRLKDAGVEFIIQPHLRFKGQPGEQWTMFFKDPSGNNLEFKSMTTIDNLFAKYNVVT